MDQPDFQSPTLAVMLGIEAVRDAVHFVNTQPTEKINYDHLIDAIIHLYKSVGLEHAEARVLYRESMDRYGARASSIMKEQLSA
jgi:hypothetical protein